MNGFFSLLAIIAFGVFVIGMVKPEIVVFWSKKKTRGTACLYLAASVLFSAIAGSAPSAAAGAAAPVSSASAASAVSQTAPSSQSSSHAAQQKPYSATLFPGYYEIGTDIPTGTYNFDIMSGKGNVTDVNDGVNLIMGNTSEAIYQKSYKNAELTEGTTLLVQQCSIKVSSSNAGEIKKRDNSSAKAVTFTAGKYTAGKDFQAGYYDIMLVSGSGNVICQDNELNAIFSTNREFGVTTYKNVPFTDGNLLDVEGVKIRLAPSR